MFSRIFTKLRCVQTVSQISAVRDQSSRSASFLNHHGNKIMRPNTYATNDLPLSSITKSCGVPSTGNAAWNKPECNRILNSSFSSPSCNLLITRGIFYAYRPNAARRMKKHGLEKRLSCRSQKEVLFRRVLKGKANLSTFDRFMNEVPNAGRKKSQRVNLFDPKQGYKTVLKKPEYFKFTEV